MAFLTWVRRGLPAVMASAIAVAQTVRGGDLTRFSLEDLMNIQVTSVSRKEQRLSKAGAAVYVITQEDIRRSGMTNIPDLLRMAPGVNVARITANTWAISVRGFNDRYSSKTLVLIDGRSVYSQEFSGVFWDQLSVPLENIERIEVIRGPGGTVWGANAVNGIISIITKSSADTQGGLVSAGAGTHDSAQGLVQYGGKAGKKGTYRAFAKYFNVENSAYSDGRRAGDGWSGLQGGIRSDWNVSSRDKITVEGEIYRSREGQNITTLLPKAMFQSATFDDRIKVDSENFLGQWKHTLKGGSETTLQVSGSDVRRLDQATDNQDVFDVDFQHRFQFGERHDLVWGFDYRQSAMDYDGFYNYRYDHPQFKNRLFSTFLQDEVRLNRAITVTFGSKFEHNGFTGFEFEPSAQVVWTPTNRSTIWASAARAIRQPTWFDQNVELDAYRFPAEGGGFAVYQVLGNRQAKAEQMFDYEIGYRFEVRNRLSLDVAGFRSHYRRLFTVEAGTPYFTSDPPPHLVIPAVNDNLANALNYGMEITGNWQATRRWRISPGYTFLQMKIHRSPGSSDMTVESGAGNSPKHEVQVRSTLNVWRSLEWDTSAYYTSALLTNLGASPAAIGGYTRLDTRLGWRFGEAGEFSITGQNLLSSRHAEFSDAHQLNATQVRRSIFGKLTWRF